MLSGKILNLLPCKSYLSKLIKLPIVVDKLLN